MPIVLFSESLRILDAGDSAWAAWHRAALLERVPGRRNEFHRRVAETIACIRDVLRSTDKIRRELKSLERTGHTPCDAHALARHIHALRGVIPLIRAAVRDGNGLPYFERLFYLPDTYQMSSLKQFQFQNTFFARWPGLPWPVRWKDALK